MKRDLMEYLICPNCSGELELDIYRESNDEIEEGSIRCIKCSSLYPVIKYIPRMLDAKLLRSVVTGYDDFLKRYEKTDQETTVISKLSVHDTDETIAKGFEFEWQRHSEIRPEHELEFLHVLDDLVKEETIKGRTILDAGCGQGRFSYFYKKRGAGTVIAFDLGEQVLITRRNLKGKGINDAHVVQASIYNPPFRTVFDLVSSIGVIHHLPEPEKGFRTLYGLLREGGKIFIWVYGYSSIIPVIRFLRSFTLGRSVKFNRFLSFFFAVPLFLVNKLYNIMNKIPGMERLAEKIPFHMYHDRGFSNIWTISFDKINSAIAVYYKRDDLQGWLDRLEDKKLGVLSERYPGKSGSSWRLMAQK